MLCESLRPVIRQFLDDMLDEKDYQEVHGHLENCARCHAFASSVGTLSYQLYELGQVTVPPDVASTVSYHFSQKIPAANEAPSFSEVPAVGGSSWKTWALAAALLIAGVWMFFTMTRKSPETFAPQTVAQLVPATAVPLGASETSADLLAHWSSLNRHYHLSKSSQAELVSLLSQLGVAVEHESPTLVVFNVPTDKWGDFEGGIGGFSGVVKEFGEPPSPGAADEFTQVSIFLE